MPCVGTAPARSINFAVSGIHQESSQGHRAVFVRSWIDAGGRRNTDNPFAEVVCKDPCQYGEEYEKD